MKVIDLLNKIANGEEVPKKIYIRDVDSYTWQEDVKEYWSDRDENNLLSDLDLSSTNLKEDVEIIEEDKKIKKLEHWVDVKSWVEGNDLEKGLEEQSEFNKNIYYKINEIIDYLEENK